MSNISDRSEKSAEVPGMGRSVLRAPADDHQVRSIEDQYTELRAFAAQHGLHVVREFEERRTARKPGRPIFNDMIRRIEKGEATGILAWHPDRLARNFIDGGRIIWMIDQHVITDMRFPTYNFEPTSQGKFMLAIMFSQSKYYVDNLSDNVKRGLRNRFKDGYWINQAPIGYVNDKQTGHAILDPEKGPLVRKAFELYATGTYTLIRLASEINGLGLVSQRGNHPSLSSYQHMLKNPFYHGIMRSKGEHVPGKHQPLITKDVFDKVQAAMQKRSKPGEPKRRHYLYRGCFTCQSCGRAMTSETHKGHNYLRCTNRAGSCVKPYLREEKVSALVTEHFKRIVLPAHWPELMLKKLDDERHDLHEQSHAEKERLTHLIGSANHKLERLTEAYASGVLSIDEFQAIRNREVEERHRHTLSLTFLKQKPHSLLEPVKERVRALQQAVNLGNSGNIEEKRDFLKNVCSNLTLSNDGLTAEFQEPWKTVAAQGESVGWSAGARKTDLPIPGTSADFSLLSEILDKVRTPQGHAISRKAA